MMKRLCFLVLILAGSLSWCSAQEIGLRGLGGSSYNRIAGKYSPGSRQGLFVSTSVFYEQAVTDRLALSTGLGIHYVPVVQITQFDMPGLGNTMSVKSLELPFYLSFTPCPQLVKNWRFRLTGGYSYVWGLEGTIKHGFFGETPRIEKRPARLLDSYHYVCFGLEAKRQFRNGQFVSVGIVQRWEAGDSYYALNPETNSRRVDCCLMVATGYWFRKSGGGGK